MGRRGIQDDKIDHAIGHAASQQALGRDAPHKAPELSDLEDPRVDGRHLPGLDGLRGVAIIAVLLYHFGVVTGGYLGVDVFFVISGFVVSNNIIRRSAEPGWFRVFWIRRFSRLAPTLAVFTLVMAAAWSFDGSVSTAQTAGLVSGLLMQYNVADVMLGAGGLGLIPLWSLSVEFHYYVVAPIALLFTGAAVSLRRSATRSSQRAAVILLVAAGVTTARLWLLIATDVSERTIYISSVTRLDGLLVGTALALLPFARLRSVPSAMLIWPALASVAALLIFAPKWYDSPTLSLGPLGLVLQLGVAVIIVAVCLGRLPALVEQVLGSRLLTSLGRRSYSLYLWHFAVGVVLVAGGSEEFSSLPEFGVQVAASLAVAEVSYRLVEMPARVAINRVARV